SELANAFGARTTPHVFVFDKNLKLVYRGAIDDNYESPAKVKQSYLLDAISNLAAGKKVDPADTKPVGCSIKRVS
ncbi:MAG: thioredoxin family protein, partial [Bacteroidota bacterium]